MHSNANSLAIEEIRSKLQEFKTDEEEFYLRLKKNGFEYGPAFQVVKQVLLGDGEALGYLGAAQDAAERIHTTILDGCLQLVIAALGPCTSLYIPIEIASFQMEVSSIPPGKDLFAHAVIVDCGGTLLTGDVTLATRDGNILALLRGVQAQSVGNRKKDHDVKNCLYSTILQPLDACLNLAELKTRMSADYPQRKSPNETRVIKGVEMFIPPKTAINGAHTGHDIKGIPRVEQNGISVQNAEKDSKEREISQHKLFRKSSNKTVSTLSAFKMSKEIQKKARDHSKKLKNLCNNTSKLSLRQNSSFKKSLLSL